MKSIITICFLFIAQGWSDYDSTSDKPLKIKRIVSVYDGDTFRADLNCNIPLFCDNISIRVAGVDTPEIRGKCDEEKALALKAKTFTESFLKSGKIKLKNPERGKYFRVVAEVWSGNINLSDALISAEFGYAYEGETKLNPWCK